MSLEGRINVDVLFHDKSGSESIKVLSLASSNGYTDGKVAIVSGTCGTSSVFINCNPTSSVGADGQPVDFQGAVTRVAFSATTWAKLVNPEDDGYGIASNDGRVSTTEFISFANELSVSTIIPGTTANYTVILYGN